MIDIVREIEAVHREVGEGSIPGGVSRSVRLRREDDAPIDDVLGLSHHLRDGSGVDDQTAWQQSAEGREFAMRSSQAWGEANLAAGADPAAAARGVANLAAGADPAAAARGVANTTAFYAPNPDAPS